MKQSQVAQYQNPVAGTRKWEFIKMPNKLIRFSTGTLLNETAPTACITYKLAIHNYP